MEGIVRFPVFYDIIADTLLGSPDKEGGPCFYVSYVGGIGCGAGESGAAFGGECHGGTPIGCSGSAICFYSKLI